MMELDYKAMPKIELHAHLTGSISRECLHEVWSRKVLSASQTSRLEDPLIKLPQGKHDIDIKTFFPLFSEYIYKLVDDDWAVHFTTRAVLQSFADDGVVYLELRTTPRSLHSAATGLRISKRAYVDNILQTIREFEETDDRLQTKLILSIDRRNSLEDALEVVELAKLFRVDGVVAIDLCGDPRQGNIERLAPAFAAAKAVEPLLRLTLHFAEIDPNLSGNELEMLLQWQPDRIGHVIHVDEPTRALILSRSKPLGLELCLSCNVQAKMTAGGFAEHHFGSWYGDSRCIVVLCTDDVGIFESPLSNEYRLAAEHFHLDEEAVLALARTGIDVIFGGQEQKERLRRLMDRFASSI